jgi:26S proteasome regulatory subunit N5
LLQSFITQELLRWNQFEKLYGDALKMNSAFQGEQGVKRYEDVHKRVIEHNIRVIAKYYKRITLKKLTLLLDLSPQVWLNN